MLKIFTVYDSKAEAYLQPFFAQATGAGIRSFSEAANSQDHQFHKHAADYTLFEIGEWDEIHGAMESHHAKTNLGTALELGDHDVDIRVAAKNLDEWHSDSSKGKPVVRGGE